MCAVMQQNHSSESADCFVANRILFLFEHLRTCPHSSSFLPFYNHHGRKGLNKKSQLFHPPYQKSFSFSPPTKTGGRKHLFSVDTWPVSVQHISVACLCCVFLFLLFVQLHAEFVVLSEGKYCIMFLIILPRLKHKNIPAHQFICVYIPTNACRCWSCHYKNYLLKYFTKKCSE